MHVRWPEGNSAARCVNLPQS